MKRSRFFEKKRRKKLLILLSRAVATPQAQINKSFLLLFSKKEVLFFTSPSPPA
jgi:hypothetical protein